MFWDCLYGSIPVAGYASSFSKSKVKVLYTSHCTKLRSADTNHFLSIWYARPTFKLAGNGKVAVKPLSGKAAAAAGFATVKSALPSLLSNLISTLER